MQGRLPLTIFILSSWYNQVVLAQSAAPAKASLEIATGEYAPLTGENFSDGGPVTAIVTAVLQRMNRQITVAYVPWKRADDGVRKGVYWAAFPYVKSPEREKVFLFSSPVAKTASGFFTRMDSPQTLEGNKSYWKNKILCRPAGYDSFSLKQTIEKYHLKMEQPLTLDSCYLMLKAKKVDLIPNPEVIGWYYIKKLFGETSGFQLLKDRGTTGTFHLILSNKTPQAKEFLEEFNVTLKKIETSGEYQKIYETSLKATEQTLSQKKSDLVPESK